MTAAFERVDALNHALQDRVRHFPTLPPLTLLRQAQSHTSAATFYSRSKGGVSAFAQALEYETGYSLRPNETPGIALLLSHAGRTCSCLPKAADMQATFCAMLHLIGMSTRGDLSGACIRRHAGADFGCVSLSTIALAPYWVPSSAQRHVLNVCNRHHWIPVHVPLYASANECIRLIHAQDSNFTEQKKEKPRLP